jgi:hypothetical protein
VRSPRRTGGAYAAPNNGVDAAPNSGAYAAPNNGVYAATAERRISAGCHRDGDGTEPQAKQCGQACVARDQADHRHIPASHTPSHRARHHRTTRARHHRRRNDLPPPARPPLTRRRSLECTPTRESSAAEGVGFEPTLSRPGSIGPAEGVGFEPTEALQPQQFSRLSQST